MTYQFLPCYMWFLLITINRFLAPCPAWAGAAACVAYASDA